LIINIPNSELNQNVNIKNTENIEIKNVILDFNGTIAIDGKIIDGVINRINMLSEYIMFYVVTADTYGTVEKELTGANCQLIKLSSSNEYQNKLDVLMHLGEKNTVCIGNGYNDRAILKQAVLGIAIIQQEGAAMQTLLAADMVCNNILDALSCLSDPNKIIATLRG
jgi:soluble P-type ATPase